MQRLHEADFAGHVLNQKWVRTEVGRQLTESPELLPDVPGLRFTRAPKPSP